jgi:hypothetical protein
MGATAREAAIVVASRRRPIPHGWVGVALAACLTVAACADKLPEQDRRILEAAPAAKLSTDILWKEYQADRRAADRKYWGRAVEVTGKVTEVVPNPPAPHILFGKDVQPGSAGVEARPLDDQAAATFAAATVGERLTLRCFCEGLAGNVVLKSCIARIP